MLLSKHFTSEQELLDWANLNIRCGDIISINPILSYHNGEIVEDWHLFYCD